MRVEIAPVVDLPDGRGVRVEVGDRRIALFRTGDVVHAIGDRGNRETLDLLREAIAAVEKRESNQN